METKLECSRCNDEKVFTWEHETIKGKLTLHLCQRCIRVALIQMFISYDDSFIRLLKKVTKTKKDLNDRPTTSTTPKE